MSTFNRQPTSLLSCQFVFIKNIVLKTNCQLSTVSWLPIRTEYIIRVKCQLSAVSQLHPSAANSFFIKNIVLKKNCQLSTVSWLPIRTEYIIRVKCQLSTVSHQLHLISCQFVFHRKYRI